MITSSLWSLYTKMGTLFFQEYSKEEKLTNSTSHPLTNKNKVNIILKNHRSGLNWRSAAYKQGILVKPPVPRITRIADNTQDDRTEQKRISSSSLDKLRIAVHPVHLPIHPLQCECWARQLQHGSAAAAHPVYAASTLSICSNSWGQNIQHKSNKVKDYRVLNSTGYRIQITNYLVDGYQPYKSKSKDTDWRWSKNNTTPEEYLCPEGKINHHLIFCHLSTEKCQISQFNIK